ncbi:MAG: hypothetical protein WBG92_02460 [Thiohalocapsa sp.]
MSEVHQRIERKHEIMRLNQLEKALLAAIDGSAVRSHGIDNIAGDKRSALTPVCPSARKNHARLLKSLADSRDTRGLLLAAMLAVAMIGPSIAKIVIRGLAARKNESAGCKINLVVPLDHQHLQVWPVPQEQDG